MRWFVDIALLTAWSFGKNCHWRSFEFADAFKTGCVSGSLEVQSGSSVHTQNWQTSKFEQQERSTMAENETPKKKAAYGVASLASREGDGKLRVLVQSPSDGSKVESKPLVEALKPDLKTFMKEELRTAYEEGYFQIKVVFPAAALACFAHTRIHTHRMPKSHNIHIHHRILACRGRVHSFLLNQALTEATMTFQPLRVGSTLRFTLYSTVIRDNQLSTIRTLGSFTYAPKAGETILASFDLRYYELQALS